MTISTSQDKISFVLAIMTIVFAYSPSLSDLWGGGGGGGNPKCVCLANVFA